MSQKKKEKKRKKSVNINTLGQAHIKATFNNIIISITNQFGQVISWSSAGKMGFRGSKKNTPYAAVEAISNQILSGYDHVDEPKIINGRGAEYCFNSIIYIHAAFGLDVGCQVCKGVFFEAIKHNLFLYMKQVFYLFVRSFVFYEKMPNFYCIKK